MDEYQARVIMVLWTPSRITTKKPTPRKITVKMLTNKDKKKISKTARRKSNYFQRSSRKTGSWLPNGTVKARTKWTSSKCWNKITANQEFYAQWKYPSKTKIKIFSGQNWGNSSPQIGRTNIPNGSTEMQEVIKSKEKGKSRYWLYNIRAIMFYGVYNIEKIKIHNSKSSKSEM